jgi:hypothetical protein
MPTGDDFDVRQVPSEVEDVDAVQGMLLVIATIFLIGIAGELVSSAPECPTSFGSLGWVLSSAQSPASCRANSCFAWPLFLEPSRWSLCCSTAG